MCTIEKLHTSSDCHYKIKFVTVLENGDRKNLYLTFLFTNTQY